MLYGYKATRLQGYKELEEGTAVNYCTATRLQGYKATRLQGYKELDAW